MSRNVVAALQVTIGNDQRVSNPLICVQLKNRHIFGVEQWDMHAARWPLRLRVCLVHTSSKKLIPCNFMHLCKS
jgi:hypothetical protein